MIETIMEIGLYLIVAILLGLIFGSLMTKLILQDRYDSDLQQILSQKKESGEDITKIKKELEHYKRVNAELIDENTNIKLGFAGQQYVLDEHNSVLDELQKQLKSKDDIIERLTQKLSLAEEQQRAMRKQHQKEVDAFLFERMDITKKYKELVKKYQKLQEYVSSHDGSWFSKIFSVPSKS